MPELEGLFARLRQWRIDNGRDPVTGTRRKVWNKKVPDPLALLELACHMAATHTTRGDLIPHYERLASICAEERRKPVV